MEAAALTYTALEILVAVCSCFGNAMVIVALWTSKCIKQTTFSLIASLAVADFMVGCVTIPLSFLVAGRVITSFYGCLFLCCLNLLFPVVSTLCLVAIAVDRFLRVFFRSRKMNAKKKSILCVNSCDYHYKKSCNKLQIIRFSRALVVYFVFLCCYQTMLIQKSLLQSFPLVFRYKISITQRHTGLVVAASWLGAVLLTFTPMFGWHNPRPSPDTETFCEFMAVIPMSYLFYFYSIVCTLIPLFIMILLYSYIFFATRRNLREKPGNCTQQQSQNDLKKEKELAGSLSLVLALYCLCWLPLQIMNFIDFFTNVEVVPFIVIDIAIIFTHANSAVNPVVYAFKIQKIRMAYRKIWRRFTACKRENRGPQINQTNQTTDTNMSSN